MACESISTLSSFKANFLSCFNGTDEDEVTAYLRCELIRDRLNRTITFCQSVYAWKILQLYDAWDKPAVRTPLEPGVLLSAKDSPEFVHPALHS